MTDNFEITVEELAVSTDIILTRPVLGSEEDKLRRIKRMECTSPTTTQNNENTQRMRTSEAGHLLNTQ